MNKVEDGNTVSVHYRGILEDGTEFDNSRTRGETLSFQVGGDQVLPGFSAGVVGMAVGDVKTVNLESTVAYGTRNEEAVQQVPKQVFPPEFKIIVGATVQGSQPDGRTFLARIDREGDDGESLWLDFNHPLAGKDLTFEIELVDIS